MYTVKKVLDNPVSQPGCHLPNFICETKSKSWFVLCIIIFPNTCSSYRLLLNSKRPDLFNVTQQDTASFLHAHQKRVEVLFNVTQQDTASFFACPSKKSGSVRSTSLAMYEKCTVARFLY
jgi:hypothetical protein